MSDHIVASTADARRDFRKGALAALGAAFTFGLSTPFAKLLLGEVSPFLMAGLLYLGSGLILALFYRLLRRESERQLSKAQLPTLSAAVFFGGVLAPVLLLLGLSRTPASAASLLLNLEGVFTALFAWSFFGEVFNRRIGLGMVLIAAGGICLSWSNRMSTDSLLGPILIAAACIGWALDNNFTRRVSLSDPMQIAMIKGIAAGGVNTLLALLGGTALPNASIIAACSLLGFLSYGVSLTLFVTALRYIGTARTGAYFSTAPFIGAVASLALGEKISLALLLAAALMGIGVWLHLTERPEKLLLRKDSQA